MLCPDGPNLCVFEGGPRGVRKIIRLMLTRIDWDAPPTESKWSTSGASADSSRAEGEGGAEGQGQADEEDEDDEDDDDDDDDDDGSEKGEGEGDGKVVASLQGKGKGAGCELLWQGVAVKRNFQGFKYQECKTHAAAKRFLDARGVGNFWDMASASSSSSS